MVKRKKTSFKKQLFTGFLVLSALLMLIVGYDLKSKIFQVSEQGGGVVTYSDPTNEKIGYFESTRVNVPDLPIEDEFTSVLGESNAERWVEVDLSEQKIKAWEGSSLFLESLVSTGLPWWPTPTGEFKVWAKFVAKKMEGGSGKYYYYLPNVPYVMFFENDAVPGYRGYSLHGTYWHNDFGRVRSHGCVNLPTTVAKSLFYWMPATGTRIVIHE